MLESLKNTLLASLGAVAMTREKLQALVDELIKRGELTREQGKKLIDEILAKGQAESHALSEKITQEAKRLLEKTPFVTRGEFRILQERVRSLESRLGAAAPEEIDAPAEPFPFSSPDETEL